MTQKKNNLTTYNYSIVQKRFLYKNDEEEEDEKKTH